MNLYRVTAVDPVQPGGRWHHATVYLIVADSAEAAEVAIRKSAERCGAIFVGQVSVVDPSNAGLAWMHPAYDQRTVAAWMAGHE